MKYENDLSNSDSSDMHKNDLIYPTKKWSDNFFFYYYRRLIAAGKSTLSKRNILFSKE